jgi:tetratricopeptide (TPR) repeat protein
MVAGSNFRMVLADILRLPSRLSVVQGIEGDLRDRRRAGLSVALAAGAVQVVLAVASENYLASIGTFLLSLLRRDWGTLAGSLDPAAVLGLGVLVVGGVLFVALRHTRFLTRESRESFRYTFSIAAFEKIGEANAPVGSGEGAAAGAGEERPPAIHPIDAQLPMLHHDLIDRLGTNVRRLSLLDLASIPTGADTGSHIHVSGAYAWRDSVDGRVLQVMPRVRMGAAGQPEDLAPRVEVTWHPQGDEPDYEHVLEQVYSGVATAIYKRIHSDVERKIRLFPSRHLRAVGLFHEAQDFERSNTVDAYDYAIELYLESIRYFKTRRLRGVSAWMAARPVLWRLVWRSHLIEARARVTYARCLIYRHLVSAVSGRTKNALFHVESDVKEAVAELRTLYRQATRRWDPDDGRKRPPLYLIYPRTPKEARREPEFQRIREALFEGLCVWSLAASTVGARRRARDHLAQAARVGAGLTATDALYLLASAMPEDRLRAKIQTLRHAADLDPRFEIVHYELAEALEQQFRARNELTPARAKPVLDAYHTVQRLNPGNIGAYAAEGYVRWLLHDNEGAARALEKGLRVKAIRKETFVGDLNYGLARIRAEAGDADRSFDLYWQALAADPAVGVLTTNEEAKSRGQYYLRIASSMLARYEDFQKTVLKPSSTARTNGAGNHDERTGDRTSERTLGRVRSLALNDFGNACHQYYLRSGVRKYRGQAIDAYRRAIKESPENAVTYYNLAQALTWEKNADHEIEEHLAQAEQLEPGWRSALVGYLELNRTHRKDELEKERDALLRRKEQRGSAEIVRSRTQDGTRLQDAIALSTLESERTELEEELYGRGGSEGVSSPLRLRSVDISPALETERADELKRRLAEIDAGIDVLRSRMAARRMEQAEQERRQQERRKKEANEEDARLEQLKSELNRIDEEERGLILPRLRKLIEGTQLAPYFGTIEPTQLIPCIPDLLEAPLREDRVDAESASTLRLLATFLARQFSTREDKGDEDRAAIERLIAFAEGNFFPESFDLALAALDLYHDRLTQPGAVRAIRTIRQAIDDSLAADPTNWNYLRWALSYYDMTLFTIGPEAPPQEGAGSDLLAIVKSLRAVTEPAAADDVLRALFARHGIQFREPRIKPDAGRWIIDDAEGMVFTVSLSEDTSGQTVTGAFDHRRRLRVLQAALNDREDVHDLGKRAVLHSLLGELHGSLGEDDVAVTEYGKAAQDDPWVSDHYNALGNHHFARERYADAVASYRRAIEIAPDDAVLFANLADAEEHATDAGGVARAVESMRRAVELMPEDSGYRERLARLEKKEKEADLVGLHGLDRIPLVTPIAVEVARDLIPLVEGTDSGLRSGFAALIDDMRAELERGFGVRVPGVRIRGNETDLPDGTYVIMVNETPLVSGRIDLSKTLVRGTAERLGLPPRSVQATENPYSGESLIWVDAASAEDVKAEILDPMEYLVWHVASVLRRELPVFMGHQEVQNLVEQVQGGPGTEDGEPTDGAALTRLTLVLKDLVDEGVPVTTFATIQDIVADPDGETPLYEIAAAVRRHPLIRPRLPGNAANLPKYRLSEEIEALLRDGLVRAGDTAVLALEPEPTQAILTAVRDRVSDAAVDSAVIVSDSAIRRATRRLVELEFPRLWVLAADEVEGSVPDTAARIEMVP